MQPEQETPQTPPEKPPVTIETTVAKKRTVFSRVRQILAWLLLIVCTLGLSGLIFVQTPIFRGILVNQLVSIIETNTNGTISIGAIQGNLWNGFTLDDVTFKLKKGNSSDSLPLLHADHIIVKASILRFLRTNVLGVSTLVLDHPVIHLVKPLGDSVWNFAMLTKPSAKNAKPTPFTQIIDLTSFRIQNGSLIARDYNIPVQSQKAGDTLGGNHNGKAIDWSDVQMNGLDLDSRFYINGAKAQSMKVNHLRFYEERSRFFAQHIGFSAYLDTIQVRIDEAKITTGNTSIWLTADAYAPEFFRTGKFTSLKHAPVNVALRGPVISSFELQQFLPKALGFLGSSPGLDLEASGEFGHLKIKRLGLDFKQQGGITIVGNLDHLDHPDSLWMNLALEARTLSNQTLDDYVPGLHIPNLSRFGVINIPRLTYTGIPQNFHTVFTAKSNEAGNVAMDAFLDFRNHGFLYRAGAKTEQLNIAAFSPSLDPTNLNTEAKLSGSGTDWRKLSTAVEVKTVAPSKYAQYQVQSLDLAATMKNGLAEIGHLESQVMGGPGVHVRHATVDLAAADLPYKFDGTIENFRLSEVLPASSARNPARVDLTANVIGMAKNFDELSGTAKVRLFDLQYQGHPLSEVNADLSLAAETSSENKLSVQSDMADISIEHRFRIGDLIRAVPEHITALVTAIKERDFPEAGMHYPPIIPCGDSMNFDYSVRIKDLRPLADFIPQTFLLAEGKISGSVSGCPAGDMNLIVEGDSLGFIMRNREGLDSAALAYGDSIAALDSISRWQMDSSIAANRALHPRDSSRVAIVDSTHSSSLALPRFGFGAPRLHITPTTFRIVAQHISNDPKQVLQRMNVSVDFFTDSVIRFGSSLLYHPRFGMIYKDQVLDFDVATIYNDILGLRLKGGARFPAGEFDFTLDTIRATYLNRAPEAVLREYRVFNDGVSHVRFTKDGLISVDTLNLIHPLLNGPDPHWASALHVGLGGTLKGDSINAWAFVPSFYLEKLPDILIAKPGAKSLGFADFQGKVRDISLGMHGTLERPEISLRLYSDAMSYGPEGSVLSFDSNVVDLNYKNQALHGSLIVHVARDTSETPARAALDSISALRLTIDSIPLMLSFKHGPDFATDSAAIKTRPLSARLTTSHFPIDIAAPFISAFRDLHGSGDINFAVTGTQAHIQYGGSATVHDGQFLLDGNRMWYLFDGSLAFADNSLKLENITLRNVPADDADGQALVNGHFDFKGFTITNFDLRLHTDRLKVLSNDSKAALKTIYGPLTISTGGGDFRFFNTLQEPWIKGTINILSGNLTFPQSDGGVQTTSTAGIIYRTIPSDSSDLAKIDTLHPASARQALLLATQSGSVRMTSTDDTLFPNRLKNIYLNDDGMTTNNDSLQTEAETGTNVLAPSFADKLRMDMQVTTQGNVRLFVPFSGVFGLIGMQLNAELKSDGSILIKRGDDLETSVAGTINLTSNSTFQFYQNFTISEGKIDFTNDFSNPTFHIVADYNGTHAVDPNEPVKIELIVTGTKSKTDIAAHIYMTNTATNTTEERQSADAKNDAIYFLASGGYFKSDQSPDVQAGVVTKLKNSVTSQLVNDLMTSTLGSSSSDWAIRQASFNLFGSPAADITAAWRSITIHANVGEGTGNSFQQNYILDFPLSTFSTSPVARSMALEVQLHPSQTPVVGGMGQQPWFLAKVSWNLLHH